MRLTTDTLLEGLADALADRIRPMIADPFTADATRMAAAVARIAGRAADDAAAIRVAENASIRLLLGEGAVLVEEQTLAQRLAQSAASADPGYRISELDAETGRLRRDLIALQVRLEEHPCAAANVLSQKIWRALRDFEAARAPRA